MIRDLARDAMAESTAKSPLFIRASVSFDYKSIKPGESPLNNPNLKFTNFEYYIKYIPKKHYTKEKPFILQADVFPRGRLRFADYQDLFEQRKKNPALNWMFGFVDFNSEIIELARQHVDLRIKLKVDMLELRNKIVYNHIKEYGSLPENGIFRDPILNKIETERFNEAFKTKKKKGASKVV